MGSRYLQGGFAPVSDELTVTDLPVTGTIPDYLDGRYVRNGPNPITAPDPYHWFKGTGMVHGVRLGDGRAQWYRNRYIRSTDVCQALGEPPIPTDVDVELDFGANTHVIGHAGRTFALVEGGFRPYELTDDLDTVGPTDFGGTLPGGYTSHPKRDPLTGELHGVAYSYSGGNTVQYSVIGTDGRVRRMVDIDVTSSRMIHDFSLTGKYVVIYDLPINFSQGWADDNSYRWDPGAPTRVGVMPRDGDAADMWWTDIDPCFVFHTLNAFDDGDSGRIVVDLLRHQDAFSSYLLGPDEGTSTFDRWTIDLARQAVTEERIDDRPQELPCVDQRRTGRRHRFGYTVGNTRVGENALPADTLFKQDLDRRTTLTRTFGDAVTVEEFAFVPADADADGDGAEDDGVLVGYAYDADTDRSDLLVVDAETLDTVAAVHLPARVPYGFCGSWIATD